MFCGTNDDEPLYFKQDAPGANTLLGLSCEDPSWNDVGANSVNRGNPRSQSESSHGYELE